MRLKNVRFKNAVVGSNFGRLKFDSEGFLVEPELSKEQMERLALIQGFELIEDKKEEKKEVEEEKVEAEEWPKHVGGGYYELPNGEKVKGKKEALKKLEELNN